LDLKTGKTVWSEQLYHIFGRDIDLGVPPMDSYFDVYHPDDKKPLQEAIAAAIKKDKPYNIEYRIYRENDGEQRWISSQGKLEKDENLEPNQLIGMSQDITGRKLAEEAYRNLALSSPMGMHFYELQDHDRLIFIGANPAADRLLGVDNQTFIGKTIEEAFPPLLQTEVPERYLQAARQGIPWETEQINYEDQQIIGAFEVRAFQTSPNKMVAQFADITNRKKIERALKDSEERYRLIAENVADVIWTMDMNFQFTYISPSILQLRGYTVEEALEQSLNETIHADSLAMTIGLVNQKLLLIESGDDEGWSPVIFEAKQYCKGGTTIWSHNNARFLPGPDKKPVSILGVTRDITERKWAEEALRESEKKYKSLTNNLNVGVYRNTSGAKGEFLEANPAIVEMFGYGSREEFLKVRVSDLYKNPDNRKEYNAKLLKEGALRNEELQLQKKNGISFIGSVSAVVVKDENDEIKYSDGTIEDITERKRAAESLRESEKKLARLKKMESLGLLAGGVAHDLNNILSGIVSYPELILLDLPEDSKFREPIETIKESGQRAVAIVQDLLTVARGVAITREPLNLNDLIDDYLHSPEFIKLKQFHPSVTVKTRLYNDLFNISGSAVHIRKVLMNLVSNASEAVESSGNVTISTKNHYMDKHLEGYDDVLNGEYVVLSVDDDGSGITSNDLEKIFEPFYTKKFMGRSGTGLGLAVVWNIMLDHKGYIDVKSDESGTIFELYFPVTRDEILGKNLSIPIEDFKGEGETILVVDDVKSQRDISSKMLDTLGYKPEAVSSGEEAVEYLKKYTVDLILLDMIMDPGINGRETYKRIIKIHPGQKAIITSGYAETEDVKVAQKLGAGRYIKKPLTLEKLGLAVKEELAK